MHSADKWCGVEGPGGSAWATRSWEGGLPPRQKAHPNHSRVTWLLPQLVFLSYSDQIQRPLRCILGPRKPRQGLRDAGKLRKQHILHQVRTGTSPPAPPQPQHPAHLHRTHACRGLGTQERASSPSAPPKSACQGHRCAPLPAARPRQGSGLQPEAKRGHWGRPPPTCPHLWRAQPPGPQRGQLQPCITTSQLPHTKLKVYSRRTVYETLKPLDFFFFLQNHMRSYVSLSNYYFSMCSNPYHDTLRSSY